MAYKQQGAKLPSVPLRLPNNSNGRKRRRTTVTKQRSAQPQQQQQPMPQEVDPTFLAALPPGMWLLRY